MKPILYGLNIDTQSGYSQITRGLAEGFHRLRISHRVVNLRTHTVPTYREHLRFDHEVPDLPLLPTWMEHLWRFGIGGWRLPELPTDAIHHVTNHLVMKSVKKEPMVVTFDNLAPLRLPEAKTSSLTKKQLYRSLIKRVRKNSTLVLCPSRYMKGQLAEEGIPEHQVRVINYGVMVDENPGWDLQTLRQSLPSTKLLLSVSGEMPRKRIDLQLKTIKELGGWTLLRVLPGGRPSTESRRLIRDLSIADRVRYIDVPRERSHEFVLALYRVADCLIHTAVYGSFEFVPIEAAASKLPVVCPRLDPMRELLDSVLFVDDFENPQALAEGIEKSLQWNPQLAFEVASRYSVERMARETYASYMSIAG